MRTQAPAQHEVMSTPAVRPSARPRAEGGYVPVAMPPHLAAIQRGAGNRAFNAVLQRAEGDAPAQEAAETAKPWTVFGVDGKSQEQLRSAVEVGYRRFDCAESYGPTTAALAGELAALARDAYEIVYKFDVRAGEQPQELRARLTAVARLFGGRLDGLVIHNIGGDEQAARTAWHVLTELKGEKTAGAIGVGNVGVTHAALLGDLAATAPIDIVENSLESVLTDPALQELVKDTGAALYYYGAQTVAQQVAGDGKTDVAEALKAAAETVNGLHGAGREGSTSMITSSGDRERQGDNLRRLTLSPDSLDFDVDYGALDAVDQWRKNNNSCTENDTAFELPPPLRAFLDEVSGDQDALRAALAQENATPDRQAVTEWVHSRWNIDPAVLDGVTVPSRKGLRKRFLRMPVGAVLAGLFGAKNCDHKWSIELVQLLLADIDTWDMVSPFLKEITD
ncbi:aldo/keto reductase [Streptomyces sp. KL118A]|uniref:aldo/keto reductase n=1 Tax=Streptomyces sp. KL118A TaxID=3045153 RepID=UPI00278BEFFA|nr:aldo/keto reductase [Streptomyces sp. KL118A]